MSLATVFISVNSISVGLWSNIYRREQTSYVLGRYSFLYLVERFKIQNVFDQVLFGFHGNHLFYIINLLGYG